jgi:site-specific DNA recombinase
VKKEVVSGRVVTVARLCTREKCSVRNVNMTISRAFLPPNLVKAAVKGHLPRGQVLEIIAQKSAQKRSVWRRAGNAWFAETGWWCVQLDTNRSPVAIPC